MKDTKLIISLLVAFLISFSMALISLVLYSSSGDIINRWIFFTLAFSLLARKFLVLGNDLNKHGGKNNGI